MAEDFIIVDKDGNEHHFPAGMDPKKAAGIVRKNLGMPDTVTVTPPKQTQNNPGGNIPIAGWQPAGTFDTTEEDTTAGKIAQTLSLASVDPLTGLGAPVDAMGAGARTTARALNMIPFRSIASGTANAGGRLLDVPAAVLDNPVTGAISPRLRNIGEIIGKGADGLRGLGRYLSKPAAAAADGVVPRLVKSPKPAGTVEDQLNTILREGMLEEMRPPSVEMPPAATLTPNGVPSRPAGGPLNPHTTTTGTSRPAPASNAYSSGSARDANMRGPAPRAPKVDAPAPPPERGVLTGKKAGDPLADMLQSMMGDTPQPAPVGLPPEPGLTPVQGRPPVSAADYMGTNPDLMAPGREAGAPLSSYAPEPPAPAEVGTLTGRTAPAPEDDLTQVLTEMLSPQGPQATSLATTPEGTTGGAFRQSGKFGKSGNLGQAGGYSSGQPPVADTAPMEGWAGYSRDSDVMKQRNAYSSGSEVDPSMMAGPDDLGMGNELPLPPDSGAGAVAESPVTSLAENPAAAPAAAAPRVTAEQAQQARSFLGSRDGARALGITEDELKTLAPGPSRTPGIVDAVKAGENRGDLTAKFLKELGIEQ